jgi:hypothetical protein
MQPLEFIKLTPRTNCGECGYPTCLAFAAAVTKGGEQPDKCPYIDKSGLGEEFNTQERGSDGLEGVARLLDEKDLALVAHLKEKTSGVDFASVADFLGCTWTGTDKDSLRFKFLAQDVELSHKGILINGEEPEDPRDQVLLYNYIHFGATGRKPQLEWIGMESLPNSISKIRTLRVYCEERLATHFTGKTELLVKTAPDVGAVLQENPEQSCSAAFLVSVLPHLPLFVLFWDEEKEDNFPAKVKVLFDENVSDYLDIESLVFASERMAERWVELSTKDE